jgi:hypothetical protein
VDSAGAGWAPLLVVERIERYPDTPNRMVGTVRFGGHRLHVELEFVPQYQGFISFVTMPKLLELHLPSQRAVVMAMNRINLGEDLSLPLDLTDDIRAAEPLDPFVPLDAVKEARLEAAADAVDIQVDWVGTTPPGTDPLIMRADLIADGTPMMVRVTLLETDGAEPLLLCVDFDSRRPMPTRPQARAIERALLPYRPAAEPAEDHSP